MAMCVHQVYTCLYRAATSNASVYSGHKLKSVKPIIKTKFAQSENVMNLRGIDHGYRPSVKNMLWAESDCGGQTFRGDRAA